jgi:1-deoxy-D-xylulose-5-phosphate synthase
VHAVKGSSPTPVRLRASKPETAASRTPAPPTYTQVFARTLGRLAERDSRIVAITAAMTDGTGLVEFKEAHPERFFDVGIAEAHAVTFAAGLARAGARPVVGIYSTFLQRAYDQIIHDVALQRLPVVFCLDRAGLVGADGPTHHGVFDLSYLRVVPGMVVTAPRDGEELADLLATALSQAEGPFAIRYPKASCVRWDESQPPQPLPIGSWSELRRGERLGVLATGAPVAALETVADRLADEGVRIGVVNCRFVKPLDRELLASLARRYRLLVTVEEGVLHGGFGSAVQETLRQLGERRVELQAVGLPDRFVTHGSREQLFTEVGFSSAQLEQRLRALWRELE